MFPAREDFIPSEANCPVKRKLKCNDVGVRAAICRDC